LIAINVGSDMDVIPEIVFCMLVIMALVTTFMTMPLLRLMLEQPPEIEDDVSNGRSSDTGDLVHAV
jgi:hypothetical protein